MNTSNTNKNEQEENINFIKTEMNNLVHKIKEMKTVTWLKVKKFINSKLKIKKEKIEEFNYAGISSYSKHRGILLLDSLEDSEKILLSVHKYAHFLSGISGFYGGGKKEKYDDIVMEAVLQITNSVEESDDNSELSESFDVMKKLLYYDKLFKKIF